MWNVVSRWYVSSVLLGYVHWVTPKQMLIVNEGKGFIPPKEHDSIKCSLPWFKIVAANMTISLSIHLTGYSFLGGK